MSKGIHFFAIILAVGVIAAMAQTTTTNSSMVVVQAANNGQMAPTPKPAIVPVVDPSEVQNEIKALEQIRAFNAATLQKQEAVLEQLDDMQKIADQMRIFAHRTGG